MLVHSSFGVNLIIIHSHRALWSNIQKVKGTGLLNFHYIILLHHYCALKTTGEYVIKSVCMRRYLSSTYLTGWCLGIREPIPIWSVDMLADKRAHVPPCHGTGRLFGIPPRWMGHPDKFCCEKCCIWRLPQDSWWEDVPQGFCLLLAMGSFHLNSSLCR